MPDDGEAKLREAFRLHLNEHGYGFHHALARHLQQPGEPFILWGVESLEFPVQIRGHDTKIDLILSHLGAGAPRMFGVGECKRANPALSDWCFVRRSSGEARGVLIEQLVFVADSGTRRPAAFVRPVELWASAHVYDIAVPIKREDHTKGDPKGEGRDAIKNALSQVLRGVNGLIEYMAHNREVAKDWQARHSVVNVVPIVFTTARLWTASEGLDQADLLTGNLASVALQEEKWVWLEEAVSHGLRHSLTDLALSKPSEDRPDRFRDHLVRQTRHVAVVTARHAREFLSGPNWQLAPQQIG